MSYRMHVLPHAFMPVVLPVLLPASQLVPLLRRSVRLAADAPKKLLLLAVVDHEPSDASEAELTAIAAAQLEQLWSRVNGPEVDAPAEAWRAAGPRAGKWRRAGCWGMAQGQGLGNGAGPGAGEWRRAWVRSQPARSALTNVIAPPRPRATTINPQPTSTQPRPTP